ncbi:hypothetical protein QOT17_022831 [Balamuthia mandrillaris]
MHRSVMFLVLCALFLGGANAYFNQVDYLDCGNCVSDPLGSWGWCSSSKNCIKVGEHCSGTLYRLTMECEQAATNGLLYQIFLVVTVIGSVVGFVVVVSLYLSCLVASRKPPQPQPQPQPHFQAHPPMYAYSSVSDP